MLEKLKVRKAIEKPISIAPRKRWNFQMLTYAGNLRSKDKKHWEITHEPFDTFPVILRNLLAKS